MLTETSENDKNTPPATRHMINYNLTDPLEPFD